MDPELQKLIELLATHQDPRSRRDAAYYGDLNAQAINKMNPLEQRYRAADTLEQQAGMPKPYESLEGRLLHLKRRLHEMKAAGAGGSLFTEQQHVSRGVQMQELLRKIQEHENARRLGTQDENRPRALAQRGASGRSF
jgi:hypothetical protein